jgi:hypothetical protein
VSQVSSGVWPLATGWMVGFRIPAGTGNFSVRRRVQRGAGAHPVSYPVGIRGLSMGVKRPGREADHSPPSRAEVKNAWSYTSTPSIRLHVFTQLFIIQCDKV